MKKIIIIMILIIILMGLGGLFYWKYQAEKIANRVYSKIEKYEFDIDHLEGEKLFHFSDTIYFNEMDVTNGTIFKDSNQSIVILSNLKVMGLYCEYDDKMVCDLWKKKNDHVGKANEAKEYHVGQAVTLKDQTKWHVISESSHYSNYVTLIRDERVDVNGDGCAWDQGIVDDPDRIPFDTSGSKKYSTDSPTNIGYYLNHTYKQTILDLEDVVSIRLPYYDEINHIKEEIGFDSLTDEQAIEFLKVHGEIMISICASLEDCEEFDYNLKNVVITEEQYKKLMPHWLFNDYSGNYLVHPYHGRLYTAIWKGYGFIGARPTTGKSLKPVIVLNKSNIVS